MSDPRLGLGLAPPGAGDPAAPRPPVSRSRAPRLAKRRHAPATPRARTPQPQPPAGPWNPFGGSGGGSDGPRQGGDGGLGKPPPGDFVFGASSPSAGQQLPRGPPPSEAPFVFGGVRESLPRFEEGWSATSKLHDVMEKLNLRAGGEASAGLGQGKDQKDGSSVFGVGVSVLVRDSEVNVLPEKLTQLNLGTGVPLQNEKNGSADVVPSTSAFGGNGAGISASSTNDSSVGAHSFASSSVLGTDAKTMPEKSSQFNIGNQAPSGGIWSEQSTAVPTSFMFGVTAASVHTDTSKNVAAGANTSSSSNVNGSDDASVLPEKITRLNLGSDMPSHGMKTAGASDQPEMYAYGSGGTAGAGFGKETSTTSDRSSEFLSATSNASSSSSDFFSTANSNTSNAANGTGNSSPVKTSDFRVGDNKVNYPTEAFLFGNNGIPSSISQSASITTDDDGNFVNDADTNTCTSSQGAVDSALPEKMTKLNIGCGLPSQSRLNASATRPPEVFVFGSSISSFPSSQTANQSNVPSQPCSFVFDKDSSATTRFEGDTDYALHDEIKKLNISRDGTSPVCTERNGSSTPEFLFRSKTDATSGCGYVPQTKVQEPCPSTNLNHSSSFSTFKNAVPAFSFGTMNAGRQTAPDECSTVKQDLPGCSKETLFGLDSIKSAYRDKKEAHKRTRKNKRPTRLRQHAQLHQVVSQETCTNGEASDVAGDYSPMDCSPYAATAEHVSTEAYEASDQHVHVFGSSISNQNSSSATAHLVMDADLATLRDESRVPNSDASEGNFGSSFSSFEEYLSSATQYSFTSVDIGRNAETGTTETCADGYGFNANGQTCDENTYRTHHEFGESTIQSSSSNFSGLNFSFGASSPQSSLPGQRRNTRRKLRTKGSSASKPSTTHAFVHPKSSQDAEDMQFSPETSKQEDSVKEQSTKAASTSAALETCETWRTSGNRAYANGHFATAEDYYTRGIHSISHLEASGRCSRALALCYSNRAATRMSLGMMREALQDCLTATSIDPSFLRAKVRAANCQLALGDLEDASRNYVACLNCNISGSDTKMFGEASDGLEKTKRVAGWTSQSKELLEKRTSPEATKALDLISDALQISPHSDSLMEMKAEALLMLRRYEEVIQLCQESVNQAERNSVLVGNRQLRNSTVSEKIQCSRRYWRPYLICKSYFFSGKLEEALNLLKKHEQVKESEENTYQERFSSLSTTIRQVLSLKGAGNESFQAGRYAEAVEHYSTALSSNSESRPFSAVCFCNRAAAYQALGQVTDAIADCSLAIVLDANYPKAISRRATLYEMIRDYGQAANDVRKLISLLESNKVNKSGVSPKVLNKHSDLKQARARLSSVEDAAKRDTPLNLYLILGVEPSCSAADIKKAYRKAALRHHPDKAAQLLVRNENADDGFWRDVAKEVYADADHLFKTIGVAYNILSDPDKRQEYDYEEELRNARKRVSKGRSAHRSPEHSCGNRGFNPRQWQSSRGSSRRWYGDDYW